MKASAETKRIVAGTVGNDGLDRIVDPAALIAVFAAFSCFSFFAHPQIILDYDDWSYVAYFRLPIPWPTFWNPSRVLPEVMMPLCGYLGAVIYKLLPALGYIRAESLCFALVLAAFETAYVSSFYRLLRKRFSADRTAAVIGTVFFILSHFLVFRSRPENNLYLFKTANLTCVFFYLIPALANASLAMRFMTERKSFEYFFGSGSQREGTRAARKRTDRAHRMTLWKKTAVLAAVYFCIFSNLFGNIILAVWAGMELLCGLRLLRGNKAGSLGEYLRKYGLCLGIVAMFLVSVLLEMFGGRAALSYGDQIPFAVGLRDALSGCVSAAENLSPAMIASAAASLIMAVSAAAAAGPYGGKQRGKSSGNRSFFPLCIASAVLIGIYIILLSSKVSAGYVKRPEILIAFFFPLFLSLSASLALAVTRFRREVIPAALLCLVMAVLVNPPGRTFAGSYSIDCDVTPQTCLRISQDLVDQVIEAERRGEDSVTADVMFTGDYGSDNWPHVTYLGDTLSRTLCRHGVIEKEISVSVHPTDAVNEKYGLQFQPPGS